MERRARGKLTRRAPQRAARREALSAALPLFCHQPDPDPLQVSSLALGFYRGCHNVLRAGCRGDHLRHLLLWLLLVAAALAHALGHARSPSIPVPIGPKGDTTPFLEYSHLLDRCVDGPALIGTTDVEPSLPRKSEACFRSPALPFDLAITAPGDQCARLEWLARDSCDAAWRQARTAAVMGRYSRATPFSVVCRVLSWSCSRAAPTG